MTLAALEQLPTIHWLMARAAARRAEGEHLLAGQLEAFALHLQGAA